MPLSSQAYVRGLRVNKDSVFYFYQSYLMVRFGLKVGVLLIDMD